MRENRVHARRMLASVGVAAAVAVAAASGSAQAAIPVSGTSVGKFSSIPYKVDCTSAPATCELYFRGTATDSGDFQGTEALTSHGHFTAKGFVSSYVGNFTGRVVPCSYATGTATFTGRGVLAQLALLPPGPGFGGADDWSLAPAAAQNRIDVVGSGFETELLRLDGSFAIRYAGRVTCG
jgi:hypothetical protein